MWWHLSTDCPRCIMVLKIARPLAEACTVLHSITITTTTITTCLTSLFFQRSLQVMPGPSRRTFVDDVRFSHARHPYPSCHPINSVKGRLYCLLHCALASCSVVYCNRSCLWVCVSVCLSYHIISPTFTKAPLSQCSIAPYNTTDRVLLKK